MDELESLIEQQQYNEAYAVIKQKLESTPENTELLQKLGLVLYYLGDLTQAEDYLIKCFEIQGSLENLYNVIVVKHELKKHEEVIYLAGEYLAIDPNNVSALDILGNSYCAKDDYPNALKAYEKAYRVNQHEALGKKIQYAKEKIAEIIKQQEKVRLLGWSDDFYKLSMFGAKNRKGRELSFPFLFKDQVIEYKLMEIFVKYGYKVMSQVSVLDIGCGDGRFLRQLIDWGAEPERLAGVDINKDIIALAQKLSAPGINYEVAHADQLPYEDKSFDIILMIGVMQHIMEKSLRRRIADELLRVLKDDGILICYNINENAETKFQHKQLRESTKGITEKELKKIFVSCNVDHENILLSDSIIFRNVPVQWGSLFDRALSSVAESHDYGIAVITKVV